MRSSTPRRLLAVLAWILCLTVRAEDEIRFEPPIGAEEARRWEAEAGRAWSGWETRFQADATRPLLTVGLVDVSRLPRDLGRTRGGRIELNASLSREAAETTFRHELAHVFVESRCPLLPDAAPLLSEAFALHASGDASRRLSESGGFPTASAARDWLVAHAAGRNFRERDATRALVRVLARGEARDAWEAYFTALLGSCREESFSASRAVASFLDVARGASADRSSSRTDFLLVDGLSGEILFEEGSPGRRAPTGSILKPSLVSGVPELMEARPAREDASWHCPGPPLPGELLTWDAALARSCNGFFLDFVPRDAGAFAPWEEEIRRLGLPTPPRTMEGRIGLLGDYALSPREAVRLYVWLDRRSPFVVDALRRTASEGTLSATPAAGWFLERGIALKTGTVRNAASEPLHAWIVAVGARSRFGGASFVAAIHATGRSAPSLLPDLRRRLEGALTGLEEPAEVQVLGLVPPGSIGLACDAGAPLAVRLPGGAWRLEGSGAVRAPGKLETGAHYFCPAAAIVLSFSSTDGTPRARRYHGILRVDALPAAETPSDVPLRAKSIRSRSGSRYVLVTSERSYITSSVLSEAPAGHSELQKALSLIVRNNRLSGRHGDRPPCDTTHCNLFGQDEAVPARARARAMSAVVAVASVEIAAPPAGRRWLPFFLGGNGAWSQIRSTGDVRAELGLDADPASVVLRGDGSVEITAGAVRRMLCEVFRNQLRLPSCPKGVEQTAGGFLFRGEGEGHGEGLDLTAAGALASEGADYRALFARFFPGLRIQPRDGARAP
ncbi:MAG: hypothetical protein ACHQPI_09415 [Thermoanaerobaculia bacterium]